MANQENFTTGNISELKQIIEKLTNTVTKQNLVIQNLTDRLEKLENNQINSENNIYQLEKRLTAVERYQNRPFLIFTNIDIPADGKVLAPILQIVNNILQVSLNPDEISIAHPLKNGNIAPIIVQFLYLQQRDIILKRASWLRGLRNSMGNPIFIHERLAKKDVIFEKKLENWTFTIGLRNHTYGLLMVKDINQLMTSASYRIIKGDNKRVCKLYKMVLHS